MTEFNYKKYSLENLENWVHDAMSSAEATPQEIYDVIRGVVEENYLVFKQQASQASELLALLNGKGQFINYPEEVKDDCMPPWGHSDIIRQYTDKEMDAMCDNAAKQDKVVKWQLPVEEVKDSDTDETEYFITFPEDLLEAASLKLGDIVSWIDNGDGTYTLKHKTMSDTITSHDPYKDEMIAAGYKMVDGVWTKE